MQQRALIAVQAARGDHPGGSIAQHGDANAVARLRLRAAKRGQQGSVLRSHVAIPHIEIQIAAAAPPVLAAERRKLRRQVRSVVQRDQLIAAVFPVQLRDGRVLAVADAFVLPGKEQLYQRAAQDHAVRENGDGLPFVTADDVVQPGKEAVCILQEALRALHIPMVGIVREGVQLRGITSLQLAKRRVLPRAEADLAEARVAVERQALLPVDGRRRQAGALQIAGIDRVDGDACKALRQRRDLAAAVRRHAGIILAVDAAEDIALRLRVPDQVDCCHSPFLSVHGDFPSV